MIEGNASKIKLGMLAMVPMLFGALVASVAFGSSPYEKVEHKTIEIEHTATTQTQVEESGPKHSYFIKEESNSLKLSAKSYIVGDLNTGEIILAENAEKVYPMASVSKLMTAHVATEIGDKEDVATISSRALATYGRNGNFRVGEKIAVDKLIPPLLLESSNDAAEIIAEHFDRTSFLNKMNQEAARLKMTDTFYNDPSGLSIKNTSTVSDMFKLTGYLKEKKPELFELTQDKSYTYKNHKWFSNNQFLAAAGYTGGKSGFTTPAKQTVVSTFDLPLGEEGTRSIGIALLQSDDRQKDVNNIVNFLIRNVYYGGEADAKSEWIKERLDIPDIREPDYVTLTFLGDIMLDRGVRSSVNKNFAGDYSKLFENLDHLQDRDIVFGNLEGPASDQGQDLGSLYSFRMNPSVIPALRGAGFNVLSVSNNHAGDWGRDAFIDTLDRLEENEIAYAGGGWKGRAESPTVVEKYGMKIGFLAFTDVGPNWLEATEEKAGILLANNPSFSDIIKKANEKVDHLVVSFHFGEEYKELHNDRQEKLAHEAVDSGAKIVIGHHPHVEQDTETYKESFIAYSLGNFIFDQKFSAETMQGMMLDMKLHRNGDMSVRKNTVKLNNLFQPESIIFGKEQKLNFE